MSLLRNIVTCMRHSGAKSKAIPLWLAGNAAVVHSGSNKKKLVKHSGSRQQKKTSQNRKLIHFDGINKKMKY